MIELCGDLILDINSYYFYNRFNIIIIIIIIIGRGRNGVVAENSVVVVLSNA